MEEQGINSSRGDRTTARVRFDPHPDGNELASDESKDIDSLMPPIRILSQAGIPIVFSPLLRTKIARGRPPKVAPGRSGRSPPLLREDLILVTQYLPPVPEDCFQLVENLLLVGLDRFLIGEDRRLVGDRLVELILVIQDGLLIGPDGRLVGLILSSLRWLFGLVRLDRVLIREDFA